MMMPSSTAKAITGMSTIVAQSLLPYWHHRAWGAIYLGVGVCTVYVHVPLVRISVNMVTHVPHVHVATHGRRNVVIFFLEEVCLFGAYLAPLPYGSTKKIWCYALAQPWIIHVWNMERLLLSELVKPHIKLG